jgi:redox-sensitive bicupin YhaK (pirin superfamily)
MAPHSQRNMQSARFPVAAPPPKTPLREPIVQYGPFVMSTEREIREAFVDFSSGKFGHLDD